MFKKNYNHNVKFELRSIVEHTLNNKITRAEKYVSVKKMIKLPICRWEKLHQQKVIWDVLPLLMSSVVFYQGYFEAAACDNVEYTYI